VAVSKTLLLRGDHRGSELTLSPVDLRQNWRNAAARKLSLAVRR
jgi:hypothetical protein